MTTDEERPEPLATLDRLQDRLDQEHFWRRRLLVLGIVNATLLVLAIIAFAGYARGQQHTTDAIHDQTSAIRHSQVTGTPLGRRLEAGQVVLLCAAVPIVNAEATTAAEQRDELRACVTRNGVDLGALIKEK